MSEAASLNLANIAYRVATEPEFISELSQQLDEGVYSEEEAAALVILLEQKPAAPGDSAGPGTLIGWYA